MQPSLLKQTQPENSPSPTRTQVINIVTGKGGGGHYASYHAIRAVLEQRQTSCQSQISYQFQIGDRIQLIFMCGHNQNLAAAIAALPKTQNRVVVDFTSDVPKYMQLADFFIGKPGPGGLSEALAMNLPIITESNP
ncbi:MAG: glycosyltransferase [Cyanobacteria bacterium J06650_10]